MYSLSQLRLHFFPAIKRDEVHEIILFMGFYMQIYFSVYPHFPFNTFWTIPADLTDGQQLQRHKQPTSVMKIAWMNDPISALTQKRAWYEFYYRH